MLAAALIDVYSGKCNRTLPHHLRGVFNRAMCWQAFSIVLQKGVGEVGEGGVGLEMGKQR